MHLTSSQTAIPAHFMRGGSSRGPFFHRADLPAEIGLRDRVLASVMGSPHPLQVDGLGGGHPLTSKAGIVSASADPGIDLDFTFAQLQANSLGVETRANCGNMLAAVVPFALETGLIEPGGETTTATVRTLNTGLVSAITVRTPLAPDTGRPDHSARMVAYDGETAIAGVGGTGSPIDIAFRDTAGSVAGSLLPTGRRRDTLALPDGSGIEVTLIDNGQPLVLIRAADLGLTGREDPDTLGANTPLASTLEHLRLSAGALMGLGDVTSASVPKMVLVSPGDAEATLHTRSFIPHSVHRSIGVLAAVTVATAACLAGTVAAAVATPSSGAARTLGIGHPAGVFPVNLRLDGDTVLNAGITRTARTLMAGTVFVPRSVWDPTGAAAELSEAVSR